MAIVKRVSLPTNLSSPFLPFCFGLKEGFLSILHCYKTNALSFLLFCPSGSSLYFWKIKKGSQFHSGWVILWDNPSYSICISKGEGNVYPTPTPGDKFHCGAGSKCKPLYIVCVFHLVEAHTWKGSRLKPLCDASVKDNWEWIAKIQIKCKTIV